MILLDTNTKLEITLAGAVSNNQIQFHTTYIDTNDDTVGGDIGVTDDTNDIVLVSAPSVNYRLIRSIVIFNNDDQDATIIIKSDNSGTERILVKQQIKADRTLAYNSQKGFYVAFSEKQFY